MDDNGGDVDVFEEETDEDNLVEDPGWIALPSADTLSLENADGLLRQWPATLVAVVGERNGGKTTLVSEIYERFLRGPFAGQLFTSSLTLIGFEKKNFLSRAESGNLKPDTQRTSQKDGLRFFHLAVSPQGRETKRTDLLIAERAGEAYQAVRHTPADSLNLLEIKKADVIVLILDGARVADHKVRSEAFAGVRGIARAFVDSGAAQNKPEIQIVTTKFDLLDSEDMAEARQALDDFEVSLRTLLTNKLFEVSIFHTAARDPVGRVEPAWGLADLFLSWLAPHMKTYPAAALPEPNDEFDSLLQRVRR